MDNRATGRRGSLPVAYLTVGDDGHRLKKKKKKKRQPQCETLPYNDGRTAEDDTPQELKQFLHKIGLSDSEDSDFDSLPYSEKIRIRNKKLLGSNRSSRASSRRSSIEEENKLSRYSSRRSSVGERKKPDMEDDGFICDDKTLEDWKLENEKKESMVTKFTELEIMALWNQFKLNFPHGTVSKSQLNELLQTVIQYNQVSSNL